MPALEEQAAERRGARTDIGKKIPLCGKAVDLAGAKVGVSGKYVAMASKIAEASEETYQKVLSGSVTLAQAAKEVKNADVPESQPDAKQPASMRYSIYEVLREIIKIVHDDHNDRLFEIAANAPPVVGRALNSFFPEELPAVAQAGDGDNDTGISQGD